MKKRTMALLAAMLMIVGVMIGSTLAWLTAKTDSVVNTFTPSNIDITLAETPDVVYKMVPGSTIDKDPIVTVLRGSEKCYLFVKLDKSANFDRYMTYDMAEGWTVVESNGNTTVYGRIVDKSETVDQVFHVLLNDKVSVNTGVTKDDMDALKDRKQYPTLTITAYASQYNKNDSQTFDYAKAWENAPKN